MRSGVPGHSTLLLIQKIIKCNSDVMLAGNAQTPLAAAILNSKMIVYNGRCQQGYGYPIEHRVFLFLKQFAYLVILNNNVNFRTNKGSYVVAMATSLLITVANLTLSFKWEF